MENSIAHTFSIGEKEAKNRKGRKFAVLHIFLILLKYADTCRLTSNLYSVLIYF